MEPLETPASKGEDRGRGNREGDAGETDLRETWERKMPNKLKEKVLQEGEGVFYASVPRDAT